jgi:hypothetical protein
MKWFWYSLLGFILLMCSCGTKKSAHLINEASKENVRTELFRFQALKDTFNVLKIGIDKSKLKITELITNIKYDKDTGTITEKTTTEREITQDSDKVIAEEESQTVTNRNALEVDHIVDTSKKLESEVKEESEDASVAFWREIGRWIGIVVAFILAFKIFWPSLKKKF